MRPGAQESSLFLIPIDVYSASEISKNLPLSFFQSLQFPVIPIQMIQNLSLTSSKYFLWYLVLLAVAWLLLSHGACYIMESIFMLGFLGSLWSWCPWSEKKSCFWIGNVVLITEYWSVVFYYFLLQSVLGAYRFNRFLGEIWYACLSKLLFGCTYFESVALKIG